MVTFADVKEAHDRIRGHLHRTPIATSDTLDREVDASVFFKCENLQKVGAFKARGALNAVLRLPDEIAPRGVVTHSSGNHGAALAFAARVRGIPCHVVMPENAPAVKIEAVRGYGANVVFCAHDEREEAADRVAAESGASLVHPFDHPHVIAGQGTAAMELLEDVPDLDIVVAPIGGGGLLAGTALSVQDRRPDAKVVGAEPLAVDDAYRSLTSGVLQPGVPDPATWADGLLTGVGVMPFAILRQAEVKIITLTEREILDAALFHLQRMKLVVEPSGATGLAAVRKLDVAGARVGVLISGGNTDFRWLSEAQGDG